MAHLVLADDNSTIRQIVKIAFEGVGFRVDCFDNGEAALLFLTKNSVDILLADVALPDVNGYELCRRIKQNSDTTEVQIVLLGSVFEPFDTARGKSVGCDAGLNKPLGTAETLELVKQLLGTKESSGTMSVDVSSKSQIKQVELQKSSVEEGVEKDTNEISFDSSEVDLMVKEVLVRFLPEVRRIFPEIVEKVFSRRES